LLQVYWEANNNLAEEKDIKGKKYNKENALFFYRGKDKAMGVVILSFSERPNEKLEESTTNDFQERERLRNKKSFSIFTKRQ
jgi:hypothetical protein